GGLRLLRPGQRVRIEFAEESGGAESGGAGSGGDAPLGEGESTELRAAQLARLGPRVGDLVWDIGCGSGAAAVEAARFGAAVIAVDRDADACRRTAAAARRHSVQLQVVHGAAPQTLEDLPEPDVVRVGGGGAETVAACADRRPERIVTHAFTRDDAEAVGRVLAEGGYAVECTLLQAVELDTTGWAERERAVAFLLSGRRIQPRQ
ncbi:methyltransferase domain-containing protein, partial [Streptomyces sp. NPDC049577]|uniref:methyltransferase domain-containing protein n=1 Tax=Streptomyces sp. NPDC049577 TaxID=3155153 RepID=UPI003418A804